MSSVSGVIQKRLFDQGGFYILSINVHGSEDPEVEDKIATVKGLLPGLLQVRSDIPLRFIGKWTKHKKHGRQFKIESWEPWSQTIAGLEKFLQICVEGFADSFVSKGLTAKYGLETFEVLTNRSTEVLAETFEGVAADSLRRAVEGWQKVLAAKNLFHLLSGDFTSSEIQLILAKFGLEAPRILQENPYRLMEISGFRFDKVDQMASSSLGVSPNDSRRLCGAILWALQEAAQEGHLFLRRGDVPSSLKGLKVGDFNYEDCAEAIGNLTAQKAVVVDPEVGIYLPSFYRYERESSRLLNRMRAPTLDIEADVFLKWYESTFSLELSALQRKAVETLIQHRVLVLTGLPGTGKCVKADTLVCGPWGFREIGSFLPLALPVGEASSTDVEVDTSVGPRRTKYVYNGGVAHTIRIQTQCGFTIEGTPEHPVRVIRDGDFCWVQLRDLRQGDPLVLVRGPDVYSFGQSVELPSPNYMDPREAYIDTPRFMTSELAQILGYLTSEGSVIDDNSWAISAYDERVIAALEKAFERTFTIKVARHRDGRVPCDVGVRIHSVALIRWFRSIGVKPEYADKKSIPLSILGSPRQHVQAYLQTLFEGDGSVDPVRCVVEYGTSSEQLAYQIQTLLLAFGVVAIRCECVRGGKPYFRLNIYGEDYDTFRVNVGFHHTHLPVRVCVTNTNKHLMYGVSQLVRNLMDEVRPQKGRSYNQFYRYSISKGVHVRHPSRVKIRQLLSYAKRNTDTTRRLCELIDARWFYDPVDSITEDSAQVVDFGVPDGHEFLSAGFISHNTTVIRTFVSLFERAGLTYSLMAPTGIAAKRLAAVTGKRAGTIHRLLGYNGSEWGYGSGRIYPTNAVIVDETSMVDQELFYRLLSALSPDTMVVFVGDAAQLPSVGPGNVLRELVTCALPNIQLTQIFRQSEKGAIVRNSHLINRGEMPVLEDPRKAVEFKFVRCSDENRIAEFIVELAAKLKAKDANFQVLSPKYDGAVGVNNLNDLLRSRLNPLRNQMEWKQGNAHFREGDRLMVVKNDYSLNVYNGDVGKFLRLDKDELVVRIYGANGHEEGIISFSENEAESKLKLAYAVTVHKSQGNEFDTIIMPIVRSQGRMLQRNLLYTAVTRARKRVWLLGEESAVYAAVKNDKVVNRNTVLAALLAGVEQPVELAAYGS